MAPKTLSAKILRGKKIRERKLFCGINCCRYKFCENNFRKKYFRKILNSFRILLIYFREKMQNFEKKFAKCERKFSHFFVKDFVRWKKKQFSNQRWLNVEKKTIEITSLLHKCGVPQNLNTSPELSLKVKKKR